MVQRKVIVRGATNQALDELDAADIPDLSAAYEAAGGIATHAGAADPHTGYQKESEKSAVSGYASLDAGTKVPIAELPTGTSGTTVALGDAAAGLITTHEGAANPHPTYETAAEVLTQIGTHEGLANPHPGYLTPAEGDAAYEVVGATATHAAAGDPHTGYRLESADHSHASTGLQAGTVAHTALTAVGANDHHAQTHATAHQPSGADAMTVDAAAATGSLRTLGTGAAQAAAGDHAHAGANPWTAVIKTADESKNSLAVVADDSMLVATLLANTNYVLALRTFFVTVAAADLKYRLVFTGTTTRVRRRISRSATVDITPTFEMKTAFDVADVILSTTGLSPWLQEDVILQVGASGGVFKLQWAQVTSNAGPTTCLEGSYLEHAVT